MRRWWRYPCLGVLTLWLAVMLAACSTQRGATEPRWMVLLTTPEMENSGLLDAIIPPFEKANGVHVKRLPVSTTKALDYAALAGIDVTLLPAGSAFDKMAGPAPTIPPFQKEPFPTPTPNSGPLPDTTPLPWGYLYKDRQLALWSEVVLAAPANDPLKLGNLNDVATCLKNVALSNALMYAPTQASEPGLYTLETRLWQLIGRNEPKDRGSGYHEVATDIDSLLKKAGEDNAYVLTPLSALLAYQNANGGADKSKLKIGFRGDYTLFLPYDVAVPNHILPTDPDTGLARAFVAYLTGPTTQEQIAGFKQTQTNLSPFQPYYHSVYVP
ncbi:MAG TPA: hypothetical protein VH186_29140 [Chloroflexia bacterium]|nr:hypothetical protein [Chloroflexia bacterium]